MTRAGAGPGGRAWAVAVFAVATLVYLPSVRHGFVYDDYEIIVLQETPRGLADFAQMFAEPHGLPLSQLPHYRAPTRATLLLQKKLHGDRPGPFHAVNAVLMGLAALGAYAVLRHRRFALPTAAAGLGALAFALHPAASSTVHPVSSGRETLLPVTLALFAVAAHLRGGIAGRGAAALLFAGAVLGKEQGLVLLPIFVAADALGLTADPPGRSVAGWARRLLPSLAVVVGYLAVRSAVFEPVEQGDVWAALRAHWASTWWGPASALAYALQTWLAPHARVLYEPPLAVWLSGPRLAWALALFGALLVGVLRLPARDRAPAVFWLLWIPAGMGVTLRILPQEAPYAERFLLLSSLGLVALVATVAARARGRLGGRTLAAAAVAVLVLFAAQSVWRGRDYRDRLAFAARWASTSPDQPNARFTHGTALAETGHTSEALAELREAVRLAPDLAPAWYNLAVLLARQGRRAEAAEALRAALAADPGDEDARHALAQLERDRGRLPSDGAPGAGSPPSRSRVAPR